MKETSNIFQRSNNFGINQIIGNNLKLQTMKSFIFIAMKYNYIS